MFRWNLMCFNFKILNMILNQQIYFSKLIMLSEITWFRRGQISVLVCSNTQLLSNAFLVLLSGCLHKHQAWEKEGQEEKFPSITNYWVHFWHAPWLREAFVSHVKWVNEIVRLFSGEILPKFLVMRCHIDIVALVLDDARAERPYQQRVIQPHFFF